MSALSQEKSVEALGSLEVDPLRQAVRRDANEQISSINHDLGVVEEDVLEVLCECVHAGCAGLIEMTVSEYEAVRRFPTRFVVKAGHEVAESERVVAESDGHVVIEATGRVGLRAVATDPRSRARHVQSDRDD